MRIIETQKLPQLVARRGYASSDKEERESFKGQLYQSTAERVDRERAEQARFAQLREQQKAARGPQWGLLLPASKPDQTAGHTMNSS